MTLFSIRFKKNIDWLIMGRSLYGILLLCVVAIYSCDNDDVFVPDTSAISIDNTCTRWDELIKDLDTLNLSQGVEALQKKHPQFYNLYFNQVLPFDVANQEEFYTNLTGYLGDDRIKKLQDTTAMIFEDFDSHILPKLNEAFKIFKYYFPETTIPNVYTFTSEYTYQRFIFEDKDRDGIGLGLDMFLGASYPYKEIDPKNTSFSKYLTRSFTKEHLVKKAIETIVEDKLGPPPGSRLIDVMIHNGKKLYILDKVLPTTPDSIILEYTANQTEWVQDNEKQIWAFFFDEELFYESSSIKVGKYTDPSPTSFGMPDAAPGQTANYIGWQIVKAFMNKSKNTTLDDLINLENSQKIMDISRYKPSR